MTMQSDTAVRRLKAWHEGKPLPLYETRHFPVAEDDNALILAFVRMGGESSPWGIALGAPGKKPTIFSVPEARNRDLVADMVAEAAPILLKHFRNPEYSTDVIEGPDHPLPLRQLWVPNPSHLELLHAISYSYTFTKWGAAARAKKLNAIGRLAGWLFREAQRPGQVSVMTATEALRSCYSFPSSNVRQSHLGYLLAWLSTGGNRERRLKAATEAEQRSISMTLDPALERDRLDELLDKWNKAQRADDERTMSKKANDIRKVLEPELVHRFELVEQSIEAIHKDKRRVNAGVPKLEKESRHEHWYQYIRLEQKLNDDSDGPAFIPSPETDRNPAAAAARYYVYAASEEYRINALLHDDKELQDEVIAAGNAVRGKILEVWDEGNGRAVVPVWVIEVGDDIPLRVREGTDLCVLGTPSRTVQIRKIRDAGASKLLIEVEVKGLKTAPRDNKAGVLPAADSRQKGRLVTLLPTAKDGISRLKTKRIWERKVPGAWITHTTPGGPNAELPVDVLDVVGEATL